MGVNMKLTPKQEKLLKEYCGNDSQEMEFIIEIAKEKGTTIEQEIATAKAADEESLYLGDDILMD